MRESEVVQKIQDMGTGFTKRDLYSRYLKKIDAYLKLNNLPLSKEDHFFNKYTEEEFDILIRKYYNIKGDVTYQKILKAKLKSDKKELTEHEIQVEVVKYLNKLKIKHFAVPNGFVRGGQDKVENARYVNYMKAEGLKNGVFDLVLLPGNGKVFFLELKTPTGRPSEHQLEWKEFFDQNSYLSAVAYGLEEAKSIVDKLQTNS